MPEFSDNHRAKLDRDGNIVLPMAGVQRVPIREEELVPSREMFPDTKPGFYEDGEPAEWSDDVEVDELTDWIDIEPKEEAQDIAFVAVPEPATVAERPRINVKQQLQAIATTLPLPDMKQVGRQVSTVAQNVAREGTAQYKASMTAGKSGLREMARGAKGSLRRFRTFLVQPVWVPGKKKQPKQRSRGMLFVTDVVQFGGTFALLFLSLFAALNYQSFWQIAKGRIDPLAQLHAKDTLTQELTFGDQLKHVPSLAVAGGAQGDLLAFLPPVGPPENRLVIPKLDLNAPIVIPAMDALLKEDWKQLEADIQRGLEDGVVHYPGTAKPGQAGNFFLTGHSSYFPWAKGDFKSVFALLHNLNVGDEYWVFYGGDRHRFVITEKKEVKPSDVSVLDQPLNRRIATLMTCTPIGTTLRRLIIVAQEVDLVTGKPLEVGEHEKRDSGPKHKMEMLPI